MSGDLIFFVLFALAYTAVWWLVARSLSSRDDPRDGEDEPNPAEHLVRTTGRRRRRRTPDEDQHLGSALAGAQEIAERVQAPQSNSPSRPASGPLDSGSSHRGAVATDPNAPIALSGLDSLPTQAELDAMAREFNAQIEAEVEDATQAEVPGEREPFSVGPDVTSDSGERTTLSEADSGAGPVLPGPAIEIESRAPLPEPARAPAESNPTPPPLDATEPNPADELTPSGAELLQGTDDMNSQNLNLPNWMEEPSDSSSTPRASQAAPVPSAEANTPGKVATDAKASQSAKKPAKQDESPGTTEVASTSKAAGVTPHVLADEPASPIPAPRTAETRVSSTDTRSTSGARSTAPSSSGGSNTNRTPAISSSDALRVLAKLEKERIEGMSQLETWTRSWSEIEKRNAEACNELGAQIEELAQAHSQCDERRAEIESRAQQETLRRTAEIAALQKRIGEIEPSIAQAAELRSMCTSLEKDLGTTRGALETEQRARSTAEESARASTTELEKLRDHLGRSQEATKEATARELDWQKRYHEDTKKLMTQLSSKTQEHEHAASELQKSQSEVARQESELRARDEALAASALRSKELEQRCAGLESSIQSRDKRISDLDQQLASRTQHLTERNMQVTELDRRIAELQKQLEEQKAAWEEQSAMFDAAQGVLKELQPKLQLLEKKLGRH